MLEGLDEEIPEETHVGSEVGHRQTGEGRREREEGGEGGGRGEKDNEGGENMRKKAIIVTRLGLNPQVLSFSFIS